MLVVLFSNTGNVKIGMTDPRLLIPNPFVLRTKHREFVVLHQVTQCGFDNQICGIPAHTSELCKRCVRIMDQRPVLTDEDQNQSARKDISALYCFSLRIFQDEKCDCPDPNIRC